MEVERRFLDPVPTPLQCLSPAPLAPPLPEPPVSLFLDFDGTLVELAPRPDAVAVDPALHDLLRGLGLACAGRVAIVSGRSIGDLKRLLGPALSASLALAGSHGVEIEASGLEADPASPWKQDLLPMRREMATFAGENGLLFEDKTLGGALHYRQAPWLADPAAAFAGGLAARHGLRLQRGKMMVEVRVPGDKGDAVDRMMALPAYAATTPIFIGDDVTDEAGFAAAVRWGGSGIMVGEGPSGAAAHALADVAAVRTWLGALLPTCPR